MKEQDLQRKIIEYLERGGHYVVKTVVTNKKGVPDLLVCTYPEGKFYAIEVKRPGRLDKVTKIQQHHIDLINKTGGKAFAADSLEKVKKEIKNG